MCDARQRSAIRLLCMALLIGAVTGCDLIGLETFGFYDTDIGHVEFEVVADESSKRSGELSFAPGDEVILRLKNTTDIEIGINLSCSLIERRGPEGKWKTPDLEHWACPSYLVELKPGDVQTRDYDLPSNEFVEDGRLEAGTYRFRTDVSDQTSVERRKADVTTPSFQIVRD